MQQVVIADHTDAEVEEDAPFEDYDDPFPDDIDMQEDGIEEEAVLQWATTEGHVVALACLAKYGLPGTFKITIVERNAQDRQARIGEAQETRYVVKLDSLKHGEGHAILHSNFVIRHLERLIARAMHEGKALQDSVQAASAQVNTTCCMCEKSFPIPATEILPCSDEFCIFRFEEASLGFFDYEIITNRKVLIFRIRVALAALETTAPFEPFPSTHDASQGVARVPRGSLPELTASTAERASMWSRRDRRSLADALQRALKQVELHTGPDAPYRPPYAVDLFNGSFRDIVALSTIFSSNRIRVYEANISLFGGDDSQKYTVVVPPETEVDFGRLREALGGSFFAFHGSNAKNWHSIISNGLKNATNTPLMETGSAYGPGIYFGTDAKTSLSYSTSREEQGINKMVAVCEIAGNIDDYRRSDEILVVPNERCVVVRMIVEPKNPADYNPTARDITSSMRSYLSSMWNDTPEGGTHSPTANPSPVAVGTPTIDQQTLPMATDRILSELEAIQSTNTIELGFRVEPDSDCLATWTVDLFGFEPLGCPLANDMEACERFSITVQVTFPYDYPTQPPFVRIVQPIMQHNGGHVTHGGSICTNFLVDGQGWDSDYSMTAVLLSVRDLLVEERVRIDMDRLGESYSAMDARSSFDNARNANGWHSRSFR